MSLQPVAVLGLDGWVNTPGEKMDNLFMHFVEANYSQTVTALGYAYSFQRILHDNNGKPSALAENMQTTLVQYFSGYYESVTSEVNVIKDPTKGSALILRIFLTAKDEYGKTFNLAKESSDVNSKTIKWANLNNFGSETTFAE